MKRYGAKLFAILIILQCFTAAVYSQEQDFDFFYFVLQWPGSYCESQSRCCYPIEGKPKSDFSIHGLWPNNRDGSYPSNCDSDNTFQISQVSDLLTRLQTEWPSLSCPSSNSVSFWTHEWSKHGTCSESILDQHSYFKTALDLKSRVNNLLNSLITAGIVPNGQSYGVESIEKVIQEVVGYKGYVQCSNSREQQQQQVLYQIYLCVDSSVSGFIDCPVSPGGEQCGSEVEFPAAF